jgi:hypothetical protein
MRPFRKSITLLSPAIIFLSALCGTIWGQSALSTIQDTLFGAGGARFNGTLTIQWSTFDANNLGTIVQQSRTVQVVNGNLQVQLAVNAGALPPANTYTVQYQSDGRQQFSEVWTVPASATSLRVSQVRTGMIGSGNGSPADSTPITESSVVGLVSDLNQRPIKGPGFATNSVAVINQNGQIDTAVGNLGDCVFVDGTTGPCSASASQTFVDSETPGGLVDGTNSTFTLVSPPIGSSLLLFRSGLFMKPGVDYSLNSATIQFARGAIPKPQDTLAAFYRIDPAAGGSISNGPGGLLGSACYVTSADQSVTNVVALTNINALGSALAASTKYIFRAMLSTTQSASGGVAATVNYTGSTTGLSFATTVYNTTAGNLQFIGQYTAPQGITPATGFASGYVTIDGAINTNSAGNFDVQFAQANSIAANTTIKAGSTLCLTQAN